MHRPLISVVMAVYNAREREILDMAISSIVEQDLSDWELLICDDGSSDDTFLWLQDWAERDGRIRLFQNQINMKAAAARNRCIEQSRGQYIAIMDADDSCSSNRLRRQAEILSGNEDIAFVGLLGKYFHKDPGDLEKQYWFCPVPQDKDFLMTLPFVHGSLMFRREALSFVKGYIPGKKTMRSEDYDLLLRMYAEGMRGINTKEAVYYIREDENTFSRRKYRYRFSEAWVKAVGFHRLHLMPRGILYAIKPLIVGIIPIPLLEWMKRRYYKA